MCYLVYYLLVNFLCIQAIKSYTLFNDDHGVYEHKSTYNKKGTIEKVVVGR